MKIWGTLFKTSLLSLGLFAFLFMASVGSGGEAGIPMWVPALFFIYGAIMLPVSCIMWLAAGAFGGE